MPTVTERRLALEADTAADLMSAGIHRLAGGTSFQEAVAFFIDHNVTVAPVTGDYGEPVGVLSVTDLLIHMRTCADLDAASCTAADLMTPTVFAVPACAPAADVVADMVRSHIHHLFVTDPDGTMVGVVSVCDVLRHLQ